MNRTGFIHALCAALLGITLAPTGAVGFILGLFTLMISVDAEQQSGIKTGNTRALTILGIAAMAMSVLYIITYIGLIVGFLGNIISAYQEIKSMIEYII